MQNHMPAARQYVLAPFLNKAKTTLYLKLAHYGYWLKS